MSDGPTTLRTETDAGVRSIVLTRAAEYNTITPALRDDLVAAVDAADEDPAVHVILLRAEGRAFCAGFGLDWATKASAEERDSGRVWDSVSDMAMMDRYVDMYLKLWYARKPTIAAVQGWCLGGGADMVMAADLLLAGESASFGHPPTRVWGTPTTGLWVFRLGFAQAKRYLLTGDEITAAEAARIGLALEVVPDDALEERAMEMAQRMARIPVNQLVMVKAMCNDPAENMGMFSARRLGVLFDGVARHTQEGLDFVAHAEREGFRAAVRGRDEPFGDYGSRPR